MFEQQFAFSFQFSI